MGIILKILGVITVKRHACILETQFLENGNKTSI